MVRINLLPVRQIKKRQRAVNELFAFGLALAVLLVGVLVVAGVISHTIGTLNVQIKELQVKKNSYNVILKEIEDLKRQKQNLEAKINTIKKLKKGSRLAVLVLDELANKTPPNRVWLKSLSQAAGSMKLDGVALDNATIAQFMDSLTSSSLFVSADLQGTQQVEIAGQKLKSFTLSVGIKPPADEVESAEVQAPGGGK